MDEQPTKRRRRGEGSVYLRPDSGGVLWIKYSRNGKAFRESTGTHDHKKAERILKQRLAAITTNTFTEPATQRVRVSELFEDLLRDYRVNGQKSIDDVQARWRIHLEPHFGHMRACDVSSTLIAKYVDARQQEGAANATINRELAALKRCFNLGAESTPRKVIQVPHFAMLREDNVRLGFLESHERDVLARECAKVGLWLRCLFELSVSFGWRHAEVLNLRVRNVNLADRTIRLDVGTTKNGRGRVVVMTQALHMLISAMVVGKRGDEPVFTREDGSRVRDFRDAWARVCCAAGVGKMVCAACHEEPEQQRCATCGTKKRVYRGLLFHDLRRSAVRNMIRRGVSQQVAKELSGHVTDSVFSRYNVTSMDDRADAARKMEPVPQDHPIHPSTIADGLNVRTQYGHVADSRQLAQLPSKADA